MTAYFVIARSDGAHIISDGAAVDEEGVLTGIVSKAALFPRFNLAVVVNGSQSQSEIVDAMEDAQPASLDDALQALPGIAYQIVGSNKQAGIRHPHVSLFAACWHPTSGAAAWAVRTDATVKAWGIQPGQLTRIKGSFDAVGDPAPALGRSVDVLDPASFDLARDGVALMEHCRRLPADPTLWDGRTDHFGIGGTVELTTCGPGGITRRELHRWPADVIGQRIRPAYC
jgi:hypothetical protein